MIGTLVNALAVLAGGGAGLLIGARIPPAPRRTALRAIALAVLFIGLATALDARGSTLVAIVSLALGGGIGSALGLGARARRWRGSAGRENGFIVASLVFAVGPMAIVGALQDGLGNPSTLFAKAALDGCTAIALASTLGPSVLGAAGTLLVYQGALALLAGTLGPLHSAPLLADLNTTGGLVIVAIGVNLLGLHDPDAADLLPALPVAVALALFRAMLGQPIP